MAQQPASNAAAGVQTPAAAGAAVQRQAPRPDVAARPTPTAPPPARPTLASVNTPPMVKKLTPPMSVRVAQLFWVLSFVIGAFCVVYLFIIRKDQLPLIIENVKAVVGDRADQTYSTAADIIFWVCFGITVAVVLAQITLLVSFNSRKPNVCWWQLVTFVLQLGGAVLTLELVAVGAQHDAMRLVLALHAGLVLLALLTSTLPPAMKWSARRHDVVRRGSDDDGSF